MAPPVPFFAWLREGLRTFGFDGDPKTDVFQLVFQLALAAGAALIAYWLIHRSQMRATEEGRRIERARLLHDLDREYYEIMARKAVIDSDGPPRDPVAETDRLRLEWVLTGKVRWLPAPECEPDNPDLRRYYINDGSRVVRVAESHYVDTISLHLMLAWSKRVSNGLYLNILSRRDVMEMWRNILPWAKANRFHYMAEFFGMSAQRKAEVLEVFGEHVCDRKRVRRDGDSDSRSSSDGFRFRKKPPDNWRGDIAALYHVIRVVVEEAWVCGRVEILDYLRAGTFNAPLWSGMDGRLRSALIMQAAR